jgi:hypothetical protein
MISAKTGMFFVLYSSNLVGRAFQSRGGDNYLPKDGEIYMNISSR